MDWNIIFSGMGTGLQLITTLITLFGIGGIIFVEKKSLGKLFEQKPEVLFGYYAKMRIHFFLIEKSLGAENNTPLLQSVSDDIINNNDSFNPDVEKIIEMQEDVRDFFDFLKKENWQIPLDLEFENDFRTFIESLYELKKVSKCKLYANIDDALKRRLEILTLISKLSIKIESEQKKIIADAQNLTEQ